MLTQCQVWITNKYLTCWKSSFASMISLKYSHVQGNTTELTVFCVGKNDSLSMEMTELYYFLEWKQYYVQHLFNQAIIIFSGSWEISFSQLWKKAGIEFYHHIFLIVQHLQLTIFLQAIPKAWPPTPWYLHFFSLTYLACTAHRCSSWIAGPGHHSLCPHSWVRVLYTLSCANGCIQSHRLTICSMMSTCRPLPWGKPAWGQNKPLLNKG